MTLTIGSLFTGYGGLDMAVEEFFGAKTVWFSEIEPAAVKVFEHHNPGVPNLGDITKIDWTTAPRVDIMCGGSPCQDMSTAGVRAGMLNGTRSGLWENMREGIATLRPKYVVWENVKGAYSAKAYSEVERTEGRVGGIRALGRVVGDLASLGYDCRWGVVRASDAGAPHRRERVFLLAASADAALSRQRGGRTVGEAATRARHFESTTYPCSGSWGEALEDADTKYGKNINIKFVEQIMGLTPGYTDANTSWSSRLLMLANGVVPQQALLALELLTGEHCEVS